MIQMNRSKSRTRNQELKPTPALTNSKWQLRSKVYNDEGSVLKSFILKDYTNHHVQSFSSLLINNRFIKSGFFQQSKSISLGIDLSQNQCVLIKEEMIQLNVQCQLHHEYEMYNQLTDTIGIPKIYDYYHNDYIRFLTMELLGPNLNELMIQNGGRFGLKTVYMIGLSLLDILESIHLQSLSHNFLTPGNIVINNCLLNNSQNRSNLYLTNFSYANIKSPISTMKNRDHLLETLEFSSASTHENGHCNYQGDLESLCFLLSYFLYGTLPWSQYMKNLTSQNIDIIIQFKLSCNGKSLFGENHDELKLMFQYAKHLKVDEKPRYNYLKILLLRGLKRIGECNDHVYDWNVLMNRELRTLQLNNSMMDQIEGDSNAHRSVSIPRSSKLSFRLSQTFKKLTLERSFWFGSRLKTSKFH
ncbi:kinase-like domain-containing protein [Globomyces pollinis-pini]|nr:kinase-like domain-containing protein [Globomyces pollinis-pini]